MTKQTKANLPAFQDETDSTHEIRRLFLSEGMEIEEEMRSVYNLSSEFAASRKNRSYPVYIAITAFTVLLMTATFGLTCGIQRDIDRITVDIEDFKDLNLAELLGALSKAQMDLKNVDRKIALARQSMDLEVERIKRAADLEIKKVEESGLGKAEKKRIEKEIREKYERQITSTRSGYEERIKQSENEANEARGRIKIIEKKVVVEKTGYEKSADLKVQSYRAETDSRMEAQEREYRAVISEYENQLKAAKSDTSREIENSRSMEQLLGLYKRALTYYSKTRGEHGCVIDPGANGNMLVDVNPYIKIKKGDRAYVLNQESKVLALVELNPDGIRLRARIIKRILPDDIQPFDKILLIKN